MKKRIISIVCFSLLYVLILGAQTSSGSGSGELGAGSSGNGGSAAAGSAAAAAPATAAAAEAASSAASDAQKRRDIIRYGIDSEVTDLIKTLDAEKEGSYNADLLELLKNSRSAKLRTAILDFFADLEWNGAEDEAVALVAGRDSLDANLVARALAYLASVKSKKGLSYIPKLIDENNRIIVVQAIGLAGKAGGKDEEGILLKWMESDAPTADLREAAIRALGDIGSEAACAKLMKLVESADEAKMTRVYACEALGKIGRKESVSSLVKAANGDDPNVRAAAVQALASFDGQEAQNAIVEALRDSVASVRTGAIRACAKKKLDSSVSAIIYKAGNDPEKSVKTEALKALSEIGSAAALKYLREYISADKNDSSLRAVVFGLLLHKDASQSMDMLANLLKKEQKEKSRDIFTQFARAAAGATDVPAAAPLIRILLADSDYQIRLGGMEWARRTKSAELKADLENIAKSDPSENMRKRAADILAAYDQPSSTSK